MVVEDERSDYQFERDTIKEEFVRMFSSIAENIRYDEDRYSILAFGELCNAINMSYSRSFAIGPSKFVELLEFYIEFFKEATNKDSD